MQQHASIDSVFTQTLDPWGVNLIFTAVLLCLVLVITLHSEASLSNVMCVMTSQVQP